MKIEKLAWSDPQGTQGKQWNAVLTTRAYSVIRVHALDAPLNSGVIFSFDIDVGSSEYPSSHLTGFVAGQE